MASNPYANLVKMLTAVTLLSQPSGTTIKALMSHLGSSRRTIFRLLEALDNLGFPLTTEKSSFNGEKTYRLLDSFVLRLPVLSLPGFSFTPQEARYLHMLLDRPDLFPDPALDSSLASLRRKLEPVVHNGSQFQIDPAHSPKAPADMPIDAFDKLLSSAQAAITAHRACAIRYRSFERSGSHLYVIHPLRLVEDSGAYYLFASVPKHDSVRLLPLDRIASLEVLDNTFQSNQDEAINTILAKAADLDAAAMTQVVVRFSARLSGSLKDKHFSPFQSHTNNSDGSSTYSIVTGSPEDLLHYILSCGPDAEILSPADLRSRAERELAASLAQYSNRDHG